MVQYTADRVSENVMFVRGKQQEIETSCLFLASMASFHSTLVQEGCSPVKVHSFYFPLCLFRTEVGSYHWGSALSWPAASLGFSEPSAHCDSSWSLFKLRHQKTLRFMFLLWSLDQSTALFFLLLLLIIIFSICCTHFLVSFPEAGHVLVYELQSQAYQPCGLTAFLLLLFSWLSIVMDAQSSWSISWNCLY